MPDPIGPEIKSQELNDWLTYLDAKLKVTTANITYFVNAATGNDTNDGLTIGTALKTILAAVNKIPIIVRHFVTISIAPGTYAETASLSGFVGSGTINLTGAGSALSDTHIVSALNITGCQCHVIVDGIKFNSTTAVSATVLGSSRVFLSYIKIDAAASLDGVFAESSIVRVQNSLISNRQRAIAAWMCSTITSIANSGTGNQIGLHAAYAGTIGKDGTQPAGTTAEGNFGGGAIR